MEILAMFKKQRFVVQNEVFTYRIVTESGALMSNLSEIELKSEYLPAFIASTEAVFRAMLGWQLSVETTCKGKEFRPGHDVTGIIGFAGGLKGTIVVSIDKEVAFAAADIFIGQRPTTINGDVLDLVGELANMIGGGAKERFAFPDIVLGLPTTVSGKDYKISFNPGIEVETVQFLCPFGSLTIQIAIQRPV